MSLLRRYLKNGTVVDPASGLNEPLDILIDDDGRIVSMKRPMQINGKSDDLGDEHADDIIDVRGCILTPGLIDVHVHLRDPGFPEKETILTGAHAAAAGGFTSLVCMPNTLPTLDAPEQIRYVLQESRRVAVRVYPSGSITYGLKGEAITDIPALVEAGIVTLTEDGKTVMNPQILYQAFDTARELNLPVSSHCEEHHLVGGLGAINRGEVSRRLGDPGIPGLAEDLIVARDILFAEETGARLHIQHVSTARAVQLVREAKARGVRVTAEAAPHHFTLTDEAVLKKGTLAKVNPPLRTAGDVAAVIEGLKDGTIDAIATDHAPHTMEEKRRPLSEAPFGLVGLETAVGLALTYLVHAGHLSLADMVRKMSLNPSVIMGLPGGRLAVGEVADITVIDLEKEWIVDPEQFFSKSRNSPFAGTRLKGKSVMTLVGGRVVHNELAGRTLNACTPSKSKK